MSELSFNPQQLTQALHQLAKAQSTSALAQQGAQVIVRHIAGNTLNVGLPRQPQAQTVNLPKPTGSSQAISAGVYQAQLQGVFPQSAGTKAQINAVLNLYSPEAGQTTLANLSQKQLSVLLDATRQQVTATAQAHTQLVAAKVERIVGNSLHIAVNINGRVESLPIKVSQPENFQVGQQVQLKLTPQNKGWQVTLISTEAKSTQPNQQAMSTRLVTLEPQVLVKLLQAETKSAVASDRQPINVPRQALTDIVLKQPDLLPKQLTRALAKLPANITQLQVAILPSGNAQITTSSQRPVLSINLTQQQGIELQQLLNQAKIPVSSGDSQQKPKTPLDPVAIAATTLKNNETASDKAVIQQKATAPEQEVKNTGLIEKIAALPAPLRQRIESQIQQLVRQLLPQSSSPSVTIGQIEQALSDPMVTKDPAAKELINNTLKQIQQAMIQGKDTDAAQIKQLLTQPALNLTPVQLTQPVSQSGLVSGLISLLQISLASRLARTQPQTQERVSQAIVSLLAGAIKPSANVTGRSVAEIQQMEQKHQLLKQLGRMFSSHQSAKLANAEQAIQGQESFHYVLPSGSNSEYRDIEILIRREQEKQQNSADNEHNNPVWHLTMKMDVGQVGQLLSKAKLAEHELELDFYTSNDAVKTLVFEHLPLFKTRLEDLGIQVARSQCQLGKIPDTLRSRPYQLFETKV